MKNEYLLDTLKRCAEANLRRYHMPGHKGRSFFGGLSGNLEKFDMTELKGLDNLHSPGGCIANSMRGMAELFGAYKSFFLVNGSSGGIVASILAAANGANGANGENGECSVICARNSHISMFNALCLANVRPIYVMPEIIDNCGICGGMSPEKVEAALASLASSESSGGNCRAVFVTSPTFEGAVSDIAKIAEIAHRHGVLLIVDEAHGAHFNFHEYFPKSALSQGADIVIQSLHKTLPALGQGSALHVSENVSPKLLEKLAFYLSVMQTTSPSYLIMASIDNVRETLETRGTSLFDEYTSNLDIFRRGLSRLTNIGLLGEEIVGSDGVFAFDKGKITLIASRRGNEIEAFLAKKGIFIEKSDKNTALLMTSIADTKDDYSETLAALKTLDKRFDNMQGKLESIVKLPSIAEMAQTPYKCVNDGANTVAVKLEDAAGKVSAAFITPYPPGIPIVTPGEIISREITEFCSDNEGFTKIIGLNDGFVKVKE